MMDGLPTLGQNKLAFASCLPGWQTCCPSLFHFSFYNYILSAMITYNVKYYEVYAQRSEVTFSRLLSQAAGKVHELRM